MYRRQFLATAGALGVFPVAGCSGLADVVPGSQRTLDLSLGTVDGPGEETPFSFDVTLTGTGGLAGAPRLEIALENAGDRALFIGYLAWPESVFPGRESDPAALRLVTGETLESLQGLDALETTTEGRRCVHTEYSPDEDTVAHRMPPGETGRGRYAVVGSSRHLEGPCPEAGEYQFRSEYSYAPASEVDEALTHEEVDWREFTWGFSVEVSAAE